MRPILSPSFTSSKMKNIFILMTEIVETFVDYYKNEMGKNDNDVIEIEFMDALKRYGNDIIASVAFGVKVDSVRDHNNEFFLMGKKLTNLGGFATTLKFFGFSMFPKLFDVS